MSKTVEIYDLKSLYEHCRDVFTIGIYKKEIPPIKPKNDSNIEMNQFILNEYMKTRVSNRHEILKAASSHICDAINSYCFYNPLKMPKLKLVYDENRKFDEGVFYLENAEYKIEILFPIVTSYNIKATLFSKDNVQDIEKVYHLYVSPEQPATADQIIDGIQPFKTENLFIHNLNDNIVCLRIWFKEIKLIDELHPKISEETPVCLYLSVPIKNAPLVKLEDPNVLQMFDITSIISDIIGEEKTTNQLHNLFQSLEFLIGQMKEIEGENEAMKMIINDYSRILIG